MSPQPRRSPALPPADIRIDIAAPLLRWYDKHRRVLPWRAGPGERADPYHVWLSEIMLQQTTVATVGPYYQAFLKRWPSLRKLAAAPQEDVLAAWAGLGYYSRARNLHACAQAVLDTYKGTFPTTEAELLKLPGIGPYTAAAIAAIAFDVPANVVDGNVERVMSRLFCLPQTQPQLKAAVKNVAAPLVPRRRAGDYAQALMDLGATICTPRSPKCDQCPLKSQCQALAQNMADAYPKAAAKKPRPVRHGLAFILQAPDGTLWLRRRGSKGLFAGMLELPSSDWQDSPPHLTDALAKEPGLPAARSWKPLPARVTHVFTHFELQLSLYYAKTGKTRPNGLWLSAPEAKKAGLPSLMQKILAESLPFLKAAV